MSVNRVFQCSMKRYLAESGISPSGISKLKPFKDKFSKKATDALSHPQKPYPTDAKALYPSAKKIPKCIKANVDPKEFNRKEFLQKLREIRANGRQMFYEDNIEEFSQLPYEELKRIPHVANLKDTSDWMLVNVDSIASIVKLPKIQFGRFMKLAKTKTPDGKPVITDIFTMKTISKLPKKEFNNAVKLAKANPNLCYEDPASVPWLELYKLPKKQFNAILDIAQIKYGEEALFDICSLTELRTKSNQELQNIISRAKIIKDKKLFIQITGGKIKDRELLIHTSALSKEEFKTFISIHSKFPKLSDVDIMEIMKTPYGTQLLKSSNVEVLEYSAKGLIVGNKSLKKALRMWSDDKTSIFILSIGEGENRICKRLVKDESGLYFAENYKIKDRADFVKNNLFIKLDSEPEKYDYDTLVKFMTSGKLKGKRVYHPIKIRQHSEFNLPQGANKIAKANNSYISQLDTATRPNKNSERITHHYSDKSVSVVDFGLGEARLPLQCMLRPNPKGNGMSIIKRYNNETIKLSSEITSDSIKIINDETGKSFEYPISEIIDANDLYRPGEAPTIYTKKIVKLLKQLSPTTLLQIIQLKKAYPNIQLPHIGSKVDAFCLPGSVDTISGLNNDILLHKGVGLITLTDIPNIVSHEILHGITEMQNLLSNKTLIDLHAKEAKKAGGLIRHISQYAIDGQKGDAVCGLNELISIMGAYNEYGIESVERAEAIRLAFPETTKAIEEALIRNTKQTMKAFGLE